MDFNKHFIPAGQHAFLSPSNYHWIRYDEETIERKWFTAMAARFGTEMHALGAQCIKLGVRLPDTSETLNRFVNDSIGFRMSPEVPLKYSDNCFGSADSAGFRNNVLRIFDLKTGVTEASFDQPMIYAAIFCLEYGFRPFDIEIELRIYQNDIYKPLIPEPSDVFGFMQHIKFLSNKIDELKKGET